MEEGSKIKNYPHKPLRARGNRNVKVNIPEISLGLKLGRKK